MFQEVPELRIGHIIEVTGSSVRVELDGSISELTRTYGGRVYPVGQFGSVIKVHFGRKVLLAYVSLLRMRNLDEETTEVVADDTRILEADLFGELHVAGDGINFSRGVRTYPLPGQAAFLSTVDELQTLYEMAQDAKVKRLWPSDNTLARLEPGVS